MKQDAITIIENDPRVPPGLFGDWLREAAVPPRLVRLHAGDSLPPVAERTPVILLGGYMSAHDTAAFPFLDTLRTYLRRLAESETPFLGICLGGQLLAAALGAEVRGNSRGERGMREVNLTAAGVSDPLFRDVPESFFAFQWHNDSFDIPAGAVHLAASAHCPGQAFRFGPCAFGLQFHPEVDSAIVADWSRRAGAGTEVLEAFRQKEGEGDRVARQLLENFLGLAGLR